MKFFVLDADLAGVIAVVEPGPSVRVITAPRAMHAARRSRPSTRPGVATASISRARGGEAVPLPPEAWSEWRDRAHVALAAEMVGTARRLFDMTLAYAKERNQFGMPIGSFQAIQHKLADMRARARAARPPRCSTRR